MLSINIGPHHLNQGDLAEVQLVQLLGHAYAFKVSGKLDLTRGGVKKEIYFLNGLPVYVSSTAQAEDLLEVVSQAKRLPAEDLLQIKTMQKEKRLSTEALVKLLDLTNDRELYALQIESFTQIVLDACGWNDGRYQFHHGENEVGAVPFFDLNPLELIHQGIKSFHSLDLGRELQRVEAQKARLTHGWETTLALPQAYYERSEIMDLFERELTVAECIPRLYREFGDLGEAMLFLYLLLITGLLELIEPEAPAKDQAAAAMSTERPPQTPARRRPKADTVYVSTTRQREQLGTNWKGTKAGAGQPKAAPPPAAEPSLIPPAPPLESTPPPAAEPPYFSEIVMDEPPAPELPAIEPLGPPGAPPPLSPEDEFDSPLDFTSPPALTQPPPIPEPAMKEEPEDEFMSMPGYQDDDDSEPAFIYPEDEILEPPPLEQTPAPEEGAGKLLDEARNRLEKMEQRLSRARDQFEKLGVDEETSLADLQAAHDRLVDEISLDALPDSGRDQLEGRHRAVEEELYEALNVLSDPDERIGLEQVLYNKRIDRATAPDMKEKLAHLQWKRGQWYLWNVSRADLARRCFQQAVELDPNKPQYYAFVGWACYRHNGSEHHLIEARAYLHKALQLSPHYDQAHYFLGVIDKREGDREQAARHFQDALNSNPDHHQARRELQLIRNKTDKPVGLLSRVFGKSPRR